MPRSTFLIIGSSQKGQGSIMDVKENTTAAENQEPEKFEEILQALEKQRNQKKNWVTNVIFLLISIMIFFQAGLLEGGPLDILIIIVVILIHEAGHFLGMRLFGYRNVQMFFIPFFGAAVSGESRDVPTSKKALVTLMGPVPGIFIGIVLGIVYLINSSPICSKFALMFIFLNAFNLLPFFPLDGGRLLQEVLFSRNRYFELVFRVLAALMLMAMGFFGGLWVLGILGVINLFTVGIPFKIARISQKIRPQLAQCVNDDMQPDQSETTDDDPFPPETARIIACNVYESISNKLKPNEMAGYISQIWERIQTRSPGIGATLGLLTVYLFSFLLALVSLFGFVMAEHIKNAPLENKIAEYRKSDGRTGLKEEVYKLDTLHSETELSEDGRLYHGRMVKYNLSGNITCQGLWNQGYPDGPWIYYDLPGELERMDIFDKGKLVQCRWKENGQWINKELDDLPSDLKADYLEYSAGPPQGPELPPKISDANDIATP